MPTRAEARGKVDGVIASQRPTTRFTLRSQSGSRITTSYVELRKTRATVLVEGGFARGSIALRLVGVEVCRTRVGIERWHRIELKLDSRSSGNVTQ